MKVLVSRVQQRGALTSDFHFTDEGEVLTLPSLVCDGEDSVRERCGCGRAFAGATSGSACTVAVVAEHDEDDVERAVKDGIRKRWGDDLVQAGWEDYLLLAAAIKPLSIGEQVRIENKPNSFKLMQPVPA